MYGIKFFIMICICFSASTIHGQVLLNGDFSYPNSGNDYTPPGSSCVTFSNTSIPNWKRSNGTPYIVPAIDPYMVLGVNLWSATEGIYADYSFNAGQQYIVEVGIRNWNNLVNPDINYTLEVIACNGLTPYFSGSSVATSGQCFHEESMVTTTSQYKVGSIGSSGTYHALVIPPQPIAYSQFSIRLKAELKIGHTFHYGNYGNVEIDYVNVKVACKGDTTFSSGMVSSGFHQVHDHIFAGSSYSSGVNVSVSNTSKTSFIASKHIELKNNFQAIVSNNAYFVAEITSCYNESIGGPYSKQYSNIGIVASNLGKEIAISPNPNDGNFTIIVPDLEEYDVCITNTIGSIVYRTILSGATKHSIIMPEVTSGNYLVKISNRNFNEIKRITVSK